MLRKFLTASVLVIAALPAGAVCTWINPTVPGTFASIQAAVTSLSMDPSCNPMTNDHNIMLTSNGPYNEQVNVRNFTNNGWSISIQAAPTFSPVLQPPATSTAAFVIANSSVNIIGIKIVANQNIPFGIVASSGYVNISSVSVSTTGNLGIYTAGVKLSSWSAVSHSTITVWNAHGLWLSPGGHDAVSFSSIQANSQLFSALYLQGSSSNTVTESYISNLLGHGAHFDVNADNNTISRSTMTSDTTNFYALFIGDSDSNTVTESYISNPGGPGVVLNFNSNYNTISQSTMASNQNINSALHVINSDSNTITGSVVSNPAGAGASIEAGAGYNSIRQSVIASNSPARYALYVNDSDSNTVTDSHISNTAGGGAFLGNGSDRNAIHFSTVVAYAANRPGLQILNAFSNSIYNSYVQGSTAAIVSGSTDTTVGGSLFAATNIAGTALAFSTGSAGLTIATSTLLARTQGRGLALNAGNTGAVSLGSVTFSGGARGIEISTQAAGFSLAVDSVTFQDLAAGATAVHFLGGTFVSTFTLAQFEGASGGVNVSAAALDPASRITMRAHYGSRAGPIYGNDPNLLVFWEGHYPGCMVTKNVSLTGPFTSIMAAVDDLKTFNNPLPAGKSCVVIRDGGPYAPQLITITGFDMATNGATLSVMADPGSGQRPLVSVSGTFSLQNSSLSLSGIDIVPSGAGMPYGVHVSSPYVQISSVNVIDPTNLITEAGVVLSSWTTVSYTSMTLTSPLAHGFLLPGSRMSSISYSTAAINGGAGNRSALFLSDASSNAILGLGAFGQGGSAYAATIQNGAYNTVSRSSFNASSRGLWMDLSSFNVVTESYLSSLNGNGVRLDSSDFNEIRLSTMASAMAAFSALQLNASSSNTISGVFASNAVGHGAALSNGSNGNALSLSTFTSASGGDYALNIFSSSFNMITGSHIGNSQGTGARLDSFSLRNTISMSRLFGSGGGRYALYLNGADSTTVSGSSLFNPSGESAYLDAGAEHNVISQSTVTSGANGYAALRLWGADYNAVSGSYIGHQASTAAYLDFNSDFNTISQSTLASNGASAAALYINFADSNTVTGCSLLNALGTGAEISGGAEFNTISFSTVVSNAANRQGLYLFNSSATAIFNSYVQGSTAAIVGASTGTTISGSAFAATGLAGTALALANGNVGLTISSSTLSAPAQGRGLALNQGSAGTVSLGSVTFTSSGRGIEISTQAGGFVLAIDSITFRGLASGATAIHFLGGTFSSSFTLANFEDASIGANVSAAALDASSRIRLYAHSGPRAGQAYENDPQSAVFWEAGSYPGCATTRNVGPAQAFASIPAALADLRAVDNPLTGHACVVIRDGGVYVDSVTVQGFINNGFSITIMADPASGQRPVVSPSAGAFAAFRIVNASVNVAGIDIVPTSGMQYGVHVSSPYVQVSSVNVVDPMSSWITAAGVALSSWTTVSYTSVTVADAYGFLLSGSWMSAVSHSTAAAMSVTKSALYLNGASSNAITGLTATNQSNGGAARIDGGVYNSVSRSSFSTPSGAPGLYVSASSFNAVSGSYIASLNGHGLRLDSADFNAVRESTAASRLAGVAALHLVGSSSNTISGVWASNPPGRGVDLYADSNYNTLSLSTFTNNVLGEHALDISNSSSNTITGSYISNPIGTSARLDAGASRNTISDSTMASNAAAQSALNLINASSNVVTRSFMLNPAGYGARLDANATYNTISWSTMSNAANYGALYIDGVGNEIIQSHITNSGGDGAFLNAAAKYNAIRQSTMAINTAGRYALYFGGASTNTISQCYMSNPSGDGVFLTPGSNWNAFLQSEARAGGSGLRAQSVTGLSVVLSTAAGGGAAGGTGIWWESSEYIELTHSYVQGSTAVYLSGSSRTVVNSNTLAGTGAAGNGLWLTNGSLALVMSSNTVLGGGMAGISLDSNSGGAITLSTNTILARSAQYGVRAANLSAASTLWIASNTIVPALSAFLDTYGVYLNGLAAGATVQNNGVYYRGTPAAAAVGTCGLCAFGSSGVRIDHNRISNPGMVTSGNYYGAMLDATPNALFLFNDLHSATGGTLTTFNLLSLVNSANAVVRNNVFLSSMTTTLAANNRMIVVDPGSVPGFSSDYNAFFSSNSMRHGDFNGGSYSLLTSWQGNVSQDINSQIAHPRWLSVAPGAEDFHPLSTGGRWDGAGFTADAVDSPTIDRGDVAASIGDEPVPNGGRPNQGSYGQTAEASKSVLFCPETWYVRKAGGADSVTIQGAINQISNPLTAHACVVIEDSGVYSEQVTVQKFANDGSSITIMADPALLVHPIVNPPVSSTAAFVIKNASVNIVNIGIVSTTSVSYGIFVSSPNVVISSVNVDSGGNIAVAGVVLSSYSSLSYSSITVQNAHGLLISGGGFNAVSYSTAVNNTASAAYALYLTNTASNTVTDGYFNNTAGHAVYISAGSRYNTIDRSTIATQGSLGEGALYLDNAPWNTVSRCVIDATVNSCAVRFSAGADNNIISQSAINGPSAGWGALMLGVTSSNTVIGSFISGSAAMTWNGNYNTLSLSTVIANSAGGWAFNAQGASNTIVDSYISNPAGKALWLNGSVGAAVDRSTITSNSAFAALWLTNVASSNTITRSYIVNPGGDGASVDGNSNGNAISLSVMASSVSGKSALLISDSDSNTVTGSLMSNPLGWGARLDSGAAYNAISQSTITSSTAGDYALFLTGAHYNAVTGSHVSNPPGYAARLLSAHHNTISQSTITSSAAGFPALHISFSSTNTVQNSYIQGSSAALIGGSTGTIIASSVLVATNTFGSAVVLQGGVDLALSLNSLVAGSGGAGAYLDAGNAGLIALSTNMIQGGRYGVFIATQAAGTQVWITSNTILPAVTGVHDTYGLHLDGLMSGATIQNNGIYYRTPGSMGSFASMALHAKSASGLLIERNRLNNPGMITNGSYAAVFFENTTNSLVTFNDVNSTGTNLVNTGLIVAENFSTGLSLRNNVFSSSVAVTGSSSTVSVDATSQAGFSSDYNNVFSSNAALSLQWGALMAQGTGWIALSGQDQNSISRNPRWLNPSAGAEDFHPLSQAGRWNGSVFVFTDGYTAATIDAADPAAALLGAETPPHGGRANMGSYGGTAEASLSPAAPVFQSMTVFLSSVVIAYTPAAGADSHIVTASTAANFSGTLVSSITTSNAALSLAPQSLTANTTYFLRLGAVWGDLTAYGAVSPAGTSTLASPPAPAAPTFAEVGSTSATVIWSANGNPPNVTAYDVVLTTGAAYPNSFTGNVGFSTNPAGALPAATLGGLAPNTTYFAFMSAANWHGVATSFLAAGSTSTLAADPIAALSTFTDVAVTSLTVHWSANGNPLSITTYTVQLSTAPDFNVYAASVAFSTAPDAGPSASFTGLSAYTTYYFRVRAFNNGGLATAFANLGSTQTLPVSLQSPALVPLSAVNVDSITATWGLVPTATGYTLVASLSSNNPPTVFASSSPIGVAATTATVTGLAPNTTYYLFVQAVGPGAATAFSAYPATATLAAAPSAAAPAFSAVELTSMTVSWLPNNNPVGVTTYTVVLSSGASYPNSFAGNIPFSTAPAGALPSASLTGLRDNTLYYAYVAAVNVGGTPSAFTALGSTVTQISPPTGVVFDEITSTMIVASAYAPAPYFSNLGAGQSGTSHAIGAAAYEPFHGEQWTARASMTLARGEFAAAGYKGRVYVFGGSAGGAPQTNVDVYDPANNQWTSLAALPAVRSNSAAASVGGKIYVVGGTNNAGTTSMANNEEYDPATNSWAAASKAVLPTSRSHLSVVAVGGRLYAFGGLTNNAPSAKTDQYDPALDAWTSRLDFTAALNRTAAASVAGPLAGRIYSAGGAGPVSGHYEYDSAANAWTSTTSVPVALAAAGAASLGGKIYVIGGAAGTPPVYEYDPAVGLWTARAPMIAGRSNLSVVAAGGRIYAVGGTGPDSAVNEEYDPGVAMKFGGLTPNTQYSFKARARNQVGTMSPETASVSTYTWAAPPSTATPSFTVVEMGSATFQWTDNGNPGYTKYLARASTSASFGGTVLATDWNAAVSTAILSLSPNVTYYFQVKARNEVGIETAYVNVGATATLAAQPAATVPAFSTVASNALTVSWLPNGNPDASLYNVVLSTSPVYTFTDLGNTPVLSTRPTGALPTASLTGLVLNTTYFAFAAGVNANGVATPYASLGSTSTLADVPTNAAQTFSDVGLTQLTASWGPNGNAVSLTTYTVQL
ncbi:MAG: right-handed parallel beta-helix repeat-containing protein, partial [Elusimicrobia bacterium]|nr:right-handed parallel beta-helix repeat-containing protein [Elusimicrobiota bacterium]